VQDHKIDFKKCEDKNIIEHCKKYKITKGEIGIGYKEFANTICTNIKKFEFVTFDYGDNYPRNDFSTRIYAKHEVFPIFEKNLELSSLYANSDITYDVNFKYLEDIFKELNVELVEYKTQMTALVDFGIIELLELLKEKADENTYLRESQKAKLLLEPTGMGDRFKALIIRK
jgi:SAM-dependent MidA family methyltransferase